MERIARLLPQIELFVEPAKLIVVDFWSELEAARAAQSGLLQKMGARIASLRDGVELLGVVCTEEQVYRLPRFLAAHEYDGVVLLPPLQRDQGTRAIVEALHKRTDQRAHLVENRPGLAKEDGLPADRDYQLEDFWENAPSMILKQYDLGALIVATIIASVPRGTPITVLSSHTMLATSAFAPLRAVLRQQGVVRYLIELGGDWPGIHHQFALSCVAFSRSQPDNAAVRLFKFPTRDEGSLEEAVSDFQRLRRQQGGTTRYGYVLRSGLPPSDTWLVEAHHPRWHRYLDDLRALGRVNELSAIGSISSPGPMHERLGDTPTEWSIVSGRQILSDGTFDPQIVDERGPGRGRRYWQGDRPREQIILQPGDVCILRFLSTGRDASGLHAAAIPPGETGWCVGPNMLRLRFNSDVPESVRHFVLTYLRSKEVGEWIAGRVPSMSITGHLLNELPVPIPDASILTAFDRLNRARTAFEKWARQLGDLQARAFGFTSLAESRRELLNVSLRAEQRLAAAAASETLSWRVRNLFPHPLAFRWRTAELQSVGIEKYMALLESAEVCLAYLSLMGCVLCEAVSDGLSISYLTQLFNRLRQRPDSGVSLGDWMAIVRELNSARQFQSLEVSTPFGDVCSFLAGNDDLDRALQRLKSKRDAFAHNRRPLGNELDAVTAEVEQDVDLLFASVDFLSRYPLREIVYVQPVGRRSQGTYNCRDLVGDHPIAATTTAQYDGASPSIGLHLIDQHGCAHLAEPWLVRRPCDQCNFPETYTFDRYLRDHTIWYKSLERGHERDLSQLRDDLKQVGIDLPEQG